MNNWKRFNLAAVIVLVLSLFGASASAVTHPFTDVYEADDRYGEAVGSLYEAGIVNGKTNTVFDLYSPVSRGDAAVMIAKALSLDPAYAPDSGFTDVNPRIKGYVDAMKAAGFVSGYGGETFRPAEFLTRGAAASLLVRAFDIPMTEKDAPFTDTGGVFKPYIDAMYEAELTKGVSATKYGPHFYVKRGDFAVLLHKSIHYQMKHMYTPVIDTAVVDATAVKLTFTAPVPDVLPPKYIVGEHLDLSVRFDGSANAEPLMIEYYAFSADRKTLILTVDFTGESGEVIAIDPEKEMRKPFDF